MVCQLGLLGVFFEEGYSFLILAKVRWSKIAMRRKKESQTLCRMQSVLMGKDDVVIMQYPLTVHVLAYTVFYKNT